MVRSLLLDRSRFCAEKLGDPVVDLNTTGPFAQAAASHRHQARQNRLQLCAHPASTAPTISISRRSDASQGRTFIFWLPVPSMTKVYKTPSASPPVAAFFDPYAFGRHLIGAPVAALAEEGQLGSSPAV